MANSLLYETLNSLLKDCIQHFTGNSNHASSESMTYQLEKIQENVFHIEPVAKDFIGVQAPKYDIVPGLQANGYRSLLNVLECLLLAIIQVLRNILTNCSKTFFRGNEHLDKLKLCSDILHQLRGLLYYAQILISLTPNGELFIDEKDSEPLMHDCEIMAKACFYDSLHGFQYCGSIQPVVHSLATFVASYNDVHRPASAWSIVKSAINSGRYMVSSELRGEQLEKVYNGGDVEFFKKFWSLHEHGMQAVPNVVGTSAKVNRIFKIPPTSFTLDSVKSPDEEVRVSFTSSLGPPKHVQARLISSVLREGQDDVASPSESVAGFDPSTVGFRTKAKPKSKNLLFFCHGGGFIALTSKSYEMVLRQWAKELDCPIFSIDYSLAPEAPFPEAFEECFFAYAWALKHADQLGTTAENIVFAGDSAGGNLVLSVAIRAGVYGIKAPDSIVAMYPACIVRYSASPARLLSVMDPLLPIGVLFGCLAAYSGVKTERVKRGEPPDAPNVSETDRPTSPSKQPVKIKYISNFIKDVGEGFTRMRNSNSGEKTEGSRRTWWDDEFDVVNPDEINGNEAPSPVHSEKRDHLDNSPGASAFRDSTQSVASSSNEEITASHKHGQTPCPGMEFMLKLPHNFQPLKSKFCGDNFRMHQSPVVKNAFISPALADDDLIQHLPYVDIVGCEFDPLFDDSVVLAKRLQKLDKPYQFHVVRGLPHGFINFQIAKEARDSSKMCLGLIKKALQRIKP